MQFAYLSPQKVLMLQYAYLTPQNVLMLQYAYLTPRSTHIWRRRRFWCCSTYIWRCRRFWCCSTHIWRRRRFWCCWCIFLSCNLLHNLWIYEDFEWMLEFENLFLLQTILQKRIEGGEEGQAQQFIVRATFSLFSRPSHLGILVLRILCVLKFPILDYKTIFFIGPG